MILITLPVQALTFTSHSAPLDFTTSTDQSGGVSVFSSTASNNFPSADNRQSDPFRFRFGDEGARSQGFQRLGDDLQNSIGVCVYLDFILVGRTEHIHRPDSPVGLSHGVEHRLQYFPATN